MSDRGVVEGAAARAQALIAIRDRGFPYEWGPKCRGCGADEFRIDGYCSCECRDWHNDEDAVRVAGDVLALVADREALLEHIRQLEKQLLGGGEAACSGGGS